MFLSLDQGRMIGRPEAEDGTSAQSDVSHLGFWCFRGVGVVYNIDDNGEVRSDLHRGHFGSEESILFLDGAGRHDLSSKIFFGLVQPAYDLRRDPSSGPERRKLSRQYECR